MRFFMRCWRNCRILPLMCGSPSDCLNSSFISCSDIFCRSNQVPVLEEDNRAIATTASIATTAPSNCSVRLVVTPMIDETDRTAPSRRDDAAPATAPAIMTAPSAITLNRPLAKFATACLPNIRLKPAPGDTLLNFGFSDSADHTSRCWIMLPAIAASASIRNGTPSAASSGIAEALAPAPAGRAVGPDHPGIGDQIAQRHQDAAADRSGNDDSTSVAPAITNQVLTSWLLATSPFSCASSRRFCVGSSVLSDRISLVGHGLTFYLERYQLDA